MNRADSVGNFLASSSSAVNAGPNRAYGERAMNGPENRMTAPLVRVVYDPLPRSGPRPGIYAELRMTKPAGCLALPPPAVLQHGPNRAYGRSGCCNRFPSNVGGRVKLSARKTRDSGSLKIQHSQNGNLVGQTVAQWRESQVAGNVKCQISPLAL